MYGKVTIYCKFLPVFWVWERPLRNGGKKGVGEKKT